MPSKAPSHDAAREVRERSPAKRPADHQPEDEAAVRSLPPLTDHLTPDTVLRLQRTAGNRAVVQLLRSRGRAEPGVVPPQPADGQAITGYEQQTAQVSATAVAALRRAGMLVRPRTAAPAGAGLQRKSSVGLAAKKAPSNFAKAVHTFWTDTANKDKSLQALSDFAMTTVNAMIPYPCKTAYASGGADSGSFSRVIWTITINTAKFSGRVGVAKVSDLTQDEVGEVVDTIYHEARHSEQYFLIARKQAGEGKTAPEIETGMSIPAEVAAEAVKDPLSGKGLPAEVKQWEAIAIGKYATYKGEANALAVGTIDLCSAFEKPTDAEKMTSLAPKMVTVETSMTGFFDGEQTKIEAIAKKDAMDKAVLTRIKAVRKAWAALKKAHDAQKDDESKYDIATLNKLATKLQKVAYAAYRAHEHEMDAWAVGGAAGKAFRGLKTKK